MWKPELATAGLIAPLEEGIADGARVRSRPGSTASTLFATSMPPRNWRPAKSIVSLATSPPRWATFNFYVWKPALTGAGVIATLEKSALDGSRVWEPSREHGYHSLRHFYASEQLEAGESVVSLARWLGHSDPGFTLRGYAHFLPRAGARGSAAIDAVFE
ncbi:hypothetical protein ACFWBS_49560 [Streptomyces mirabilis]|uniref:hypothetical protein n=1 Tax=Streptomyces mirabilis TaxID=68239 RepID=UPI003647FE80